MTMVDPRPNYHINPSQRTPCVLVLDASGSMDGSPIEQLNQGLTALEQELKRDPTAAMRVQIAIVCVGGPAGDADILLDWTDAGDFMAFELSTGGLTPLGQGMRLTLDMIERQKEVYRENGISYTRPWIFMISDGEPTDDWEVVADDCRKAESDNRCIVFPIAVEDANMEALGKFSKNPPKKLEGLKFVELFQWLSTSLSSASRSAPGETTQMPSIDAWAAVES